MRVCILDGRHGMVTEPTAYPGLLVPPSSLPPSVTLQYLHALPPSPPPPLHSTYNCYKGGCATPPDGMDSPGCPLYSHPAQLVDNRNCTNCME